MVFFRQLISSLLIFWLALGLLLLPLVGYTAPPSKKLKKISFGSGMSALVPVEFQQMPDDAVAAKYPAPRRPLAAWTSSSGQIDFIVTEKSTPFRPSDLSVLLRFYKANILQIYSSKVEFTQEKILAINGQDFIAFEFISTLSDGSQGRKAALRRYTYLLYTVLPPLSEKGQPRLVSCTFTCPAVISSDWQPLAQKVMASVRIK